MAKRNIFLTAVLTLNVILLPASPFIAKAVAQTKPGSMYIGCSKGKRINADRVELTSDGDIIWYNGTNSGGIYHPDVGEGCQFHAVVRNDE